MKTIGVSTSANKHNVRRRLRMQEYVPYQLAIVSSRLSHALEEVFGEDHGLTRTEWRVLALASEVESCRASDLVEWSGVDAVAIHRAIKHLGELGLVERTAALDDKRARPLRLTSKGMSVYLSIVPNALALEQRLLANLDKDDVAAFRRVLEQLLAAQFDAKLSSSP